MGQWCEGQNSLLGSTHEMSEKRNKFAKYVLVNIWDYKARKAAILLSKNHASLIAHVSYFLHGDTVIKVKLLLVI